MAAVPIAQIALSTEIAIVLRLIAEFTFDFVSIDTSLCAAIAPNSSAKTPAATTKKKATRQTTIRREQIPPDPISLNPRGTRLLFYSYNFICIDKNISPFRITGDREGIEAELE
jgi:hypothetical protein